MHLRPLHESNGVRVDQCDLSAIGYIDLLDQPELEQAVSTFQYGYQATDLNGNGNVDLLDMTLLEENINQFIFTTQP